LLITNQNGYGRRKINRTIYEQKIQAWELLIDSNNLDALELQDKVAVSKFVNLFMGEDGFVKASANERFDVLFVDVLNRTGLMKKILAKPHGQEILLRITRLYDEVKKHSITIDLFGFSCQLLDLNSLIKAKETTNRPKDQQVLLELKVIKEKLEKK
jgi:hypothetical protein